MPFTAIRQTAAIVSTSFFSFIPLKCLAGGEWLDGPYKDWFQNLKRPDFENRRFFDENSRSCCGVGDVVKTKFKVEPAGDKYPENQWYAWLNNKWMRVPAEKIVKDYAPDGRAYLFISIGDNTIMCFVRSKGGI
jgi:hypothetical protein